MVPIPDYPLYIVPTPSCILSIIPLASYDSPGPNSLDRTGWFYVTVPDPRLPAAAQERMLRDHCRHELAATALHEGYPGHHLHLVQAQRQASETRKNVSTPLTVEGWALYCEDMMGEEGFYRSEEEQFFQRVHLLWRAVRILLDVGLHTRGMTFEQAVEYLTSHLGVDRANAEAEVRRYCAEPAYQLCYAVGRRELLKLRDDFRAARGGGGGGRRRGVGVHPRGMTVGQAVEYLAGHRGVHRANAGGEVRRYCAGPAYQLCYAGGGGELLKLPDDFRAGRGGGGAFTLRAFHDAVLR